MQPQPASEENRAAALIPRPRAPWRVERAEAIGPLRLHVRFRDGAAGEVDLSRLVNSPEAGVFASLRDPTLFGQVGVETGVVVWPNGLDLAPDAMHRAILRDGLWIP